MMILGIDASFFFESISVQSELLFRRRTRYNHIEMMRLEVPTVFHHQEVRVCSGRSHSSHFHAKRQRIRVLVSLKYFRPYRPCQTDSAERNSNTFFSILAAMM
jgi:hypothetical protein